MTAVAAILFWVCAGLIVYTHLGYPLVLRALVAGGADAGASTAELGGAAPRLPDRRRLRRGGGDRRQGRQRPRPRLPARAAAADRRLRRLLRRDRRARPRGRRRPRPRAARAAARSPPNAGAERASGELLAFSDANSVWAPDALRRLVEPFADPAVGYVCGQVRFIDAGGDNLEGAYWRYEMAVREMESALAGVTAGNGAIYAVRRDAYIPLAPSGSHDLCFPSSWPSAACARSTRPGPGPRRRWCRPWRASSPASGG